MIIAGNKCGANVLSVNYEKFNPNGVTVLILLSESHLSIHTYPEQGYAAIDCYTCGDKVNPEIAANYLIEIFQPKEIYMRNVARGNGDING